MKTLSALAAATALTLASAAGSFAADVTPLATTKSTQAPPPGQTAAFGGLGVGATAGIVVASALLLTVVIGDDDDSTSTSSTTGTQ